MNDLINYYTKNAQKVAQSHGFDSEYTLFAIMCLQGAKMGMDVEGLLNYAHEKIDQFKAEILELA